MRQPQKNTITAVDDGLDFEDVRAALMRIPEISLRLRSAQRVLERERRFDVDLISFMTADHVTFRRYSHLRTWVGEIIKDGLCERLARNGSADAPSRHFSSLLRAVVENDPALEWFWPSIAGQGGIDCGISI